MLILVDLHSGVPVYRQMIEQIRFQIASGTLRPGHELPSTRVLSQQLGVNPMTVSKAYSALETEGVIEHRPGLPLVVAPVNPDRAERRRAAQLERVLAPAVVAARQLGLDTNKAVTIFRALLQESARASR